MNVKINKTNYQIKPASEMTIKEYVSLFSTLKPDANGLEVLICYLSVVTGLKYNDAANINLDEKTIKRLYSFVGEIIEANDIPVSKEFYHKKSGKTIYQKNLNWRTLGARKLIEDRKADNQLEQAIYLLSVYLSDDYDSEKIEEIYIELQDYNAIEVLGFIVFFFKKLLIGKKSEMNFIKRQLKKLNINIPKRSNK